MDAEAERFRDLTQALGSLLDAYPHSFADTQARAAMTWLVEHAQQRHTVDRLHAGHAATWQQLPEAARCLARRRQLAALAARLAMRNGYGCREAVAWVIAVAGMTRKDFRAATDAVLVNGDRLHVWQWRELRELGLRDDFYSRRQVERWMQLDQPWLFDARWCCPLHLVDPETFAACGLVPPAATPEDCDATG